MSKKRILILFGISLLSLNIMLGQTSNAELEVRAKNGDIQAMLELAQNNVESNEKIAVKWYEKAAKAGNVDAMLKLAELYSNSNEKMSIKWYEKAAKAGNVDAMLKLGVFYIDTNPYKGLTWLGKAAETGNVEAQYQYAKNTITQIPENGGYETYSTLGWDYLNSAAKAGYAPAQFLLGRISRMGIEVYNERSKKIIRGKDTEAFEWLYRAAANPEYTESVAKEIFDDSIGGVYYAPEKKKMRLFLIRNGKMPLDALSEKEIDDVLESVTFSKEASKSGFIEDINAEEDLGYRPSRDFIYNNKDKDFMDFVEYIRENPAQRDKLLELAEPYNTNAGKEFKSKFYTLAATLLLSDNPTEDESKRIFDYANKAFESKNDMGLLLLGICYLNGIGTPKNQKEAIEWFAKAKLNGSPLAGTYLTSLGCDRKYMGLNLVYVKEDNKEGLYNQALDKFVVPLGKYGVGKNCLIGHLAWVYQNGCVGAVNDKGDLVIPIKFDSLKEDKDGAFIIATAKSGQEAAYTKDGKLLAPLGKYTGFGAMTGGDITVYNGKKVGLIDGQNGKLLVPCKYDMYLCFSQANGRMIFTEGENLYIFTHSGAPVATISGRNLSGSRLLAVYRKYMGTEYVTYSREANRAW